MSNCNIFVIGSFYDSVDWACLLAIPTIYAFCHVYIISGCSSRSVWSWLTLDSDRFSRTSSCTQFTSNASLLTSCISSKSVFSSKFGRKWTFFIGIVDGPLWLEWVQESTVEKGIVKLGHDDIDIDGIEDISEIGRCGGAISFAVES